MVLTSGMPEKWTTNVRARQLGLRLRGLRVAAGLSADAVAAELGCSQGKISRIELAQTGVGRGDLFLMLDLYGVEPELREQYWQLARAGRERGWWHSYRDVITDNLSTFVAFEAEAQALHTWSWGAITGLLQTPEYARAIFASDPRWQTPEEIDRLVSARMARQDRLTDGGLDLWVVLDESLLRRPIGGPAVLADQLDRLATPAQGVTVQVLPQSVVWHPGLNGAFTVVRFPEHPTIVFAEALTGDLHVEREADVARYTLAFDHLRAAAASPEASRAMLLAARDALKKEG